VILSRPGLPRPAWTRPVAEATGLLVVFLLFTRLHAAAGRDGAAANANARALQSAERGAHLGIELGLNRWLAGHAALGHLATYVYRSYYVVVAGVLLWAYLRHAGAYPRLRRTMVAMLVLVLPIYWAVPMSPPRFALPGAVDIVARYDILGQAARDSWTTQAHYTAMPSMHVGWSLWCAYAVWSVHRAAHPRLSLLPWLFPLLMTAVVVTTANHYLLDVAGSLLLVAAAIAATAAWTRALGSRRSVTPRLASPS
jgi:hypothetical protein